MSQNRQFSRDNSSDYQKGYYDGQHDAFAASELDAYYAGVGFGKREHGDMHLGFTNANERRQFEKGISEKDHHFNAYRVKPLSFWERLFGRKDNAEMADYTTRKQTRRQKRKARKSARKEARTAKRQSKRDRKTFKRVSRSANKTRRQNRSNRRTEKRRNRRTGRRR